MDVKLIEKVFKMMMVTGLFAERSFFQYSSLDLLIIELESLRVQLKQLQDIST